MFHWMIFAVALPITVTHREGHLLGRLTWAGVLGGRRRQSASRQMSLVISLPPRSRAVGVASLSQGS
jgi:lauroyl/myristoyl acyltransferase